MNQTTANEKSLWIQGWTGINHSYAMVNQYQLLALANIPSIKLLYSELPVQDGRWSKENVGSGFNESERLQLASITPYNGQTASGIYRIHTPNSFSQAECKVITFLVTEFGLDNKSFVKDANFRSYISAGNIVVTPSNWSRNRIIDFGFDKDSVFIVPHGVDGTKFYPLNKGERQLQRTTLGYDEHDVVFLNVGAPIWNKGMDLMLEAFFRVRKKHKNAKLLIKDQEALYGISVVSMIQNLTAQGKISLDNDDINSIRIVPKTLSIDQLRQLYGMADYYLSPYRAEGFNLPVIEAIACGTQVIVTDGGSTDDFCDEHTSTKIPSVKLEGQTIQGHYVGAFLQPDIDALVDIMDNNIENSDKNQNKMNFGRINLLEKFSWRRAGNLIAALI